MIVVNSNGFGVCGVRGVFGVFGCVMYYVMRGNLCMYVYVYVCKIFVYSVSIPITISRPSGRKFKHHRGLKTVNFFPADQGYLNATTNTTKYRSLCRIYRYIG